MKISVILTSYNHEQFIRESIESVLKQTYQDFEFIIVDDCSSDSSWNIICEYKKEHPDIVVIRHNHNWGDGVIAAAVREYASGDYIAIHHSDDIWEEDKLEKQAAVLQNNPQYAAVFTHAQAVNENGSPYKDTDGFYFDLFSKENRTRHEWLNYFFYHGNCLCHPSVLIKKSAYEEDGFFRKGLQQIPDFVKWIQLCKKHEIYVLPEKLVKFRIRHEGKNTSGMRADTQIRSTVELNLMLMEYASIHDREEFLKIFPKAQRYCTDDFFSSDYALGRICMEEGMPSYTRMFGVQLLYRAFNDPKQCRLIQERTGYTDKRFKRENGERDIFGILPKAFEQVRSIYIDEGGGYDSKHVICEKFALGESASFEMRAQILIKEGGRLSGLRFDPAEGVMAGVKIEGVTLNGIAAETAAENAFCRQDGEDIFVNLDPIYSIKIPDALLDAKEIAVVIAGRVARIGDEKIAQAVMSKVYGHRAQVQELEGRLRRAGDEKEELKERLRRAGDEKEELKEWLQRAGDENTGLADKLQQADNTNVLLEEQNVNLMLELDRIKNTRIYTVCAKLKGIKEKLKVRTLSK